MDNAIKTKQELIPQNLIAIRGTMQIHQIVCNSGELKYRSVSSFCGLIRGLCDCFEIKQHNLLCYSMSSPIPGPSRITSSRIERLKTNNDISDGKIDDDKKEEKRMESSKGKGIGKKVSSKYKQKYKCE